MDKRQLETTARALVAPHKGILAADESTPTIAKRFATIGVTSTPESRLSYRESLFTASGLGDHVSGVILFDETLRQSVSDGRPVPQVLEEAGVIPGIKVDKGAKPLALHPGEVTTEGLDGLRERCEEYRELGARFTKWRAVYKIFDGKPSHACIEANAQGLARFAALSQEAGLVPIVEPEVLMDGAHDLETCANFTQWAFAWVFQHLYYQGVHLEGMLLKPNMVLPGKGAATQAGVQEVAEATLRVLGRTVPAAVPGIVFLSGGQSDVDATKHLDAMNRMGPHPWELSFSYGRALQTPALAAWAGDDANRPAAQAALLHRARCNGAARSGSYDASLEQQATTV
jgi:fructose-bisphosphate aldolase class I